VNIKDDDKSFLLLCSIARSFEHVMNTNLYKKEDTTTLEKFQEALRIKRLIKFKDTKVDDIG